MLGLDSSAAAGDDAGEKEWKVRRHHTSFSSLHLAVSRLRDRRPPRALQPHFNYMRYQGAAMMNALDAADGVCAHLLLHRYNHQKPKVAANVGTWSSDGRKLIVGTHAGEFLLWEGDIFRFERPITAHQQPIRSLAWSPFGQLLISGDAAGVVKYFSPQLSFVDSIPEAHAGAAVRALSFAPTESKFVSAGDDGLLKIWDWERKEAPEARLAGHLSDVRCAAWHPSRALVLSGGKDSSVRLWDPRSPDPVSTIQSHKNTVLCCDWSANGNWFATGSRDFQLKVFDVRNCGREVCSFQGHNREVCSVAWHPVHDACLVSGGFNGSMIYWIMGHEGPHTVMGRAHNYSVNTLMWHPVGHQLASAANDGIVKFWCREPPGSSLVSEDAAEEAVGTRFGPVTPEEATSVLPDVASHPLASGAAAFEGTAGAPGVGGAPLLQGAQYHSHHQPQQQRMGLPPRPQGQYSHHSQGNQQHYQGGGGRYQGGNGTGHYQPQHTHGQGGVQHSRPPPPGPGMMHQPPPMQQQQQHAHNRQAADSFLADAKAMGGGDRKRSRFA